MNASTVLPLIKKKKNPRPSCLWVVVLFLVPGGFFWFAQGHSLLGNLRQGVPLEAAPVGVLEWSDVLTNYLLVIPAEWKEI